eukprot:351017-Chlamydomonas_euryale.AAC.13
MGTRTGIPSADASPAVESSRTVSRGRCRGAWRAQEHSLKVRCVGEVGLSSSGFSESRGSVFMRSKDAALPHTPLSSPHVPCMRSRSRSQDTCFNRFRRAAAAACRCRPVTELAAVVRPR